MRVSGEVATLPSHCSDVPAQVFFTFQNDSTQCNRMALPSNYACYVRAHLTSSLSEAAFSSTPLQNTAVAKMVNFTDGRVVLKGKKLSRQDSFVCLCANVCELRGHYTYIYILINNMLLPVCLFKYVCVCLEATGCHTSLKNTPQRLWRYIYYILFKNKQLYCIDLFKKYLFFLFVYFVVSIYQLSIKCELIGKGSPRHLNTFPNFYSFSAVRSAHISSIHTVLLLLLTVPMYTMLSKI